jgi:hypothetical protein
MANVCVPFLDIMSRNHFAVVEMELRNAVNYLTTGCLLLELLAVARIRNGTRSGYALWMLFLVSSASTAQLATGN